MSYQKRLREVNDIYNRYARIGLSNREIWRRHVYPVYGISERTFYNLIGREDESSVRIDDDSLQYLLFKDSDF